MSDYPSKHENKTVCASCFADPDVISFIRANAKKRGCDFCDSEETIRSIRFGDLIKYFKECINEFYDLAGDNLPPDKDRGGYMWETTFDTDDLIREQIGLELPKDTKDRLHQAICDEIGYDDDWCRKDPLGPDRVDERMMQWSSFAHSIKHEARFFIPDLKIPIINEHNQQRFEILPFETLKEIGQLAHKLNLVKVHDAGTVLYRVRSQQNGRRFTTPEELGPPDSDHAILSNRMSPPGIPMFYGSFDEETALAETVKGEGEYAIGTWQTLKNLTLLDLSDLPAIPSIFAKIPRTQEWSRDHIRFFHELVDDFIKPVERDDRVHVDYVPTQVVTEYFRYYFHNQLQTAPVEGIIYPSARFNGDESVVIFCGQERVEGLPDSKDPWLRLLKCSVKQIRDQELKELTRLDVDFSDSGEGG